MIQNGHTYLNKSTAFATNLFKQVHSFSTIKGLKLQFQKKYFPVKANAIKNDLICIAMVSIWYEILQKRKNFDQSFIMAKFCWSIKTNIFVKILTNLARIFNSAQSQTYEFTYFHSFHTRGSNVYVSDKNSEYYETFLKCTGFVKYILRPPLIFHFLKQWHGNMFNFLNLLRFYLSKH